MADNTVAIDIEVQVGDLESRLSKIEASLGGIAENGKKVGDEVAGGFDAAEKGAKAASEGTKSFGGSIGTVLKSLGLIAIAAQVFMFIKDLLMKNQAVMDAFNTATIAFEIILKKVFESASAIVAPMKAAFEDPKQAVKDLWEAIKKNIVNRLTGVADQFTALGRIIEGVFNRDLAAIKEAGKDFATATIQMATGLDEAQQAAVANGFKEFAVDVKEATIAAVAQADSLVKLRNEVKLLEADQRALILVRQKEAEDQRQIRDDISRTLADRIEANQKLGEIQAKQLQEETEIANKRIELAEKELALDKNNLDLQVALKDAKTELADVEERIGGQKSEQLTNEKALEQELLALRQELALVGIADREKELLELEQHYEALAEMARLAGDTETDVEGAKRKALGKLRDRWLKEDVEKTKEAEAAKQAIRSASFDAASGLVSSLGQLVAASGEQSKGAVALQKTIAVAQIAIDTAKAVVGAIAQAQSVPYPGNLIAMATGVAAVVAGIASAVTTLNSSPMPGPSVGQPPSASSAIASASAPSIDPVTTNTTELAGAQGAQLAPIQAFVVETEMTGNQQNINQIENQVTFGIDG